MGFPGGGDGGQKILVGYFEIMFLGWLTRPSPLGFRRSGGGGQVSSLPLGLCPCYLSLGHVSVGHPVFTGRLHPQGWRNLRHRLLSDSAGHATGEGAQGGGSHWDWQLCVIPAARLAGESPPCPSSLRSSQQAGSAKAATLILHNCLSALTPGGTGCRGPDGRCRIGFCHFESSRLTARRGSRQLEPA